MEITKEVAENCVAWIENNIPDSASAYVYEDINGKFSVYMQVDDYDFELSENEIINRSILSVKES